MVSVTAATEWMRQNRFLFYIVSFVAFWIVISLQSTIRTFLAGTVSPEMLNFATIVSMWVLAIYIFPIIGAVLIVYFFISFRSRR